jgi:hypothetical protein
MRQLGKPATPTDRERMFSLLTLAASLRGIPMTRGRTTHVSNRCR